MKSGGKLAGGSLSPSLPADCWLEMGRGDARGATEVLSRQESTAGLRSPAGAVPQLLPHAPDQQRLHPGIELPRRRYPHGSYFGLCPCGVKCVSVAPRRLLLRCPTTSCFSPKAPRFSSCSSSIHFSPRFSWRYGLSVEPVPFSSLPCQEGAREAEAAEAVEPTLALQGPRGP